MYVSKTFDGNLVLKDAYLIASSQACKVDGSAKILDLGSGLLEGDIIIDVSAIETDSKDEKYTIGAQISDSATFASGIYEVASLILGNAPLHSSASASVSNSPSTSVSSSASSSPSASVSHSPSTSVSPSGVASGSPSTSVSSSVTTSPSASLSHSISASLSGSATTSPSASPTTSPSASASASTYVGDGVCIPGNVDMLTGRYMLRFRNAIANNVTKRYMRIYTTVQGSMAHGGGINFTAYLAKVSSI